MARQTLEIPTVNTAAAITLNADGTCAAARACIGAVSWKPVVLHLKELAGQRLSEELLRKSVQGVRSAVEPASDVRGSAAYKREMAVEFAARALMAAWTRAQTTVTRNR
jgi:carbon-monoxide dehydrogenase medium subunit